MKAFKVFIFGLLYGWFVKVAFDRIYRGNDMEDIRNENASLREYVHTLESKLQARSSESKSTMQATVAPSTSQPAAVQSANQKDNLQVIRGIGPVIEKRLNNAGVYTFEALARLSAQELENVLGNARRLAQEADLIAQAKQLARQKKR